MSKVDMDRDPVVIFWEMTKACALSCRHCRAKAQPQRHPLELTTEESFKLMDQLAEFDSPPIVVLSGGDPFMRRDLFEIAEKGLNLGMTVSVSPSATALVTPERLDRLYEIGVRRVSFSLDGADAASHDKFRGFTGTFDRTMDAFRIANDAGVSFQVNTTLTQDTFPELPRIVEVVQEHGAAMWDLFFLVPTGRGIMGEVLSAEGHEEAFDWILDNARNWSFRVKTTLGQPYRRKMVQRRLRAEGRSAMDLSPKDLATRWPTPPTNDGRGIFFISHIGEIYPSGFLPVSTGNVRKSHIVDVYRNAPEFLVLRDRSQLSGKCGRCPFNVICGGSRARAYAYTGELTAADPTCVFQPGG